MLSLRPRPALLVGLALAVGSSAQASRHYTVRPGDNVDLIAKHLGIPVRALRRANPGVDVIQPGQKLHLSDPADDDASESSHHVRSDGPASSSRQAALHARRLKAALAQWKAYKRAVAAQRAKLKVRLARWKAYKAALRHERSVTGSARHAALVARERTAESKSYRRHLARLAARHHAERLAQRSSALRARRADRLAAARSTIASRLVRTALACRGARYVYGSDGRGRFDCSGLTRFVYRRALGVDLPHSSSQQYGYGHRVARGSLKPGDLLFFHTDRPGISHVGIYIGNGRFVHAANSRRGVTVDTLGSGFYRPRLVGARRVGAR